MAINWVDSMSVSNDAVDNDHKHLINIINKIEQALGKDENKKELRKGLNDLQDYADIHFNREEAIMKSVNYPHYYRHFKEHRELLNTLNNIKSDIFYELDESGKIKDSDSLIELLRHWLLDHVVKEDLLLKPHLKKLITAK